MDKRRLLKIKLKSLAAEAAIIRKEEQKTKRPELQELREEMHAHRVGAVREETRATLLAYSYLRQKKYRDIEGRSDVESAVADPSGVVAAAWEERVHKIATMVVRYGGPPKAITVDFVARTVWDWLKVEGNRPKAEKKPKVPYTGRKEAAAS